VLIYVDRKHLTCTGVISACTNKNRRGAATSLRDRVRDRAPGIGFGAITRSVITRS